MKEYLFLGFGVTTCIVAGIYSAELGSFSKALSGPCSSLDENISVVKASKHIHGCLELTGDIPMTGKFSKSTQAILLTISRAKDQGKNKLFDSDIKGINRELGVIREELIDRKEL